MTLQYTLIRTKRRSLSIQIKPDGTLIARAPLRMSLTQIEEFLEQKRGWIEKHLKRMQERGWNRERQTYSEDQVKIMKSLLKLYIVPRVQILWEGKNLPNYTSIKITKSEHRWGSCSAKNGLCFSYRLAEYLEKDIGIVHKKETFYASEIKESNTHLWLCTMSLYSPFIDAIIIHELAHLREKNHQKPFWNLVYRMMPEYEAVMKRRGVE